MNQSITSSPPQTTTAYTQPPPPIANNIAADLGINSPLDAGVLGALAMVVWKQSQIVAVLRHTDQLQSQTLSSLKSVVKSLQNIVESHDRRLNRLEGKTIKRRKLEPEELETQSDEY